MRRYRTEIVLGLAVLALTLAAFGHACRNGFVNFDDDEYVVNNRHVRAGLSAAGAAWALRTTYAANWHPLTWLSLQLDASLYGPRSAWGFHLTNVLLHAAAAVLLFLALRRLTGAAGRSALVAALFAVHPTHVESVAWVSERKDVLSGLFWMLTLLAYARYAERPGWRRYLLVLAVFAVGLTAKPMLVTLPCVLLLLDYWPLRRLIGSRNDQAILLEKLPLLALTVAACLVTLYAQRGAGAVVGLEHLTFGERLLNAVCAYAGYLGKLIWPAGLAAFYPHPHGHLLLDEAGRAALLLAAITALVAWRRRQRYLTVGWLWFLGTLVPVIGLVQVGSQGLADRYTYIPYVGLFIAMVWGIGDLAARWRTTVRPVGALTALLLGVWSPFVLWRVTGLGTAVLEDPIVYLPLAVLTAVAAVAWVVGFSPGRVSPTAVAAAFALGACVALSARQVRLWNNSIWLWENALLVTHDNGVALAALGEAYWNSRHPERVERARTNLQASLILLPQNARARNNLGVLYLDQGQLDDAEAQFTLAREEDPTLPTVVVNLGTVLARRGQLPQAAARYEEALRLDPNSMSGHARLGRVRAALGCWTDAEGHFRQALALEPLDADLRADLAWALWHQGHIEDAAREYAALTAADPEWPERAREAAWGWATDAHAGRRSGHEAVRRAEEAWQAGGDHDARRADTLAAAYAEAGRFDEAAAAARQALELACDDRQLRAEVGERLLGYLDHRAYHQ
jgi:Tfp pilus assembly protein PilF